MPHATVRRDTTAADALASARAGGADVVVVLHDDGSLDAVVETAALAEAPPSTPAVAAGDGDPPTARPNETAVDLVERVRRDDLAWLVVTDSSGRFAGVVDARALLELARQDRLP